MVRQANRGSSLLLFATAFAVAGCYTGPSVNGTFSRTYTVSGPVRLELSNASGEVDITAGAAGTVSIHAEVRSSGLGFENPQKRLDDIVSDPPVEQRGDTIRVGNHCRASAKSFSEQQCFIARRAHVRPDLVAV